MNLRLAAQGPADSPVKYRADRTGQARGQFSHRERHGGAMEPTFVGYLIGALVIGGIGAAIGDRKGRAAQGFWLGALLGLIGVIIIACLGPTDEHETARLRGSWR